MAKIILTDEKAPRANSLRGAVYFYTRNGQAIAAKWPRKRGPAKTAEHKQQVNWFRATKKAEKWAVARDQIARREATAGTPLMPSDLFQSASVGRLISIHIPPNTYYRSYRAMADVSDSLDTITNVPGYTLRRGEDFWEGVPAASGGGGAWLTITPQDPPFYTNATSGLWFRPAVQIKLASFLARGTWGVGYELHVEVWTLNSFKLDTRLWQSTPWSVASAGNQYHQVDVAGELVIGAGTYVAILLVRTDGTGSQTNGTNAGTSTQVPFPVMTGPGWCDIQQNVLTPGMTLGNGVGNPYYLPTLVQL